MCCEVPVKYKAQPMPQSSGFPPGWRFVIDQTMDGYSKEKAGKSQTIAPLEGLKLLPPSGTISYYSVEAAVLQNHAALAGASPEEFYQHIGAMPALTEAVSKTTCGVCENCTKDACGRCAECRSAPSGVGRHCYQKVRFCCRELNISMNRLILFCGLSVGVGQMCFEESVDAKARRAVGFPDGWRFYFAKKHRVKWTQKYEPIPTLWILSPGGKPYRSAEAAIGGMGFRDGARIASEFYEHVGLSIARKQYASTLRQQSLSKYRVKGSRVYCTTKKQWGVIEKKFQVSKDVFQYSVRTK